MQHQYLLYLGRIDLHATADHDIANTAYQMQETFLVKIAEVARVVPTAGEGTRSILRAVAIRAHGRGIGAPDFTDYGRLASPSLLIGDHKLDIAKGLSDRVRLTKLVHGEKHRHAVGLGGAIILMML